jgi:hypothetical protein
MQLITDNGFVLVWGWSIILVIAALVDYGVNQRRPKASINRFNPQEWVRFPVQRSEYLQPEVYLISEEVTGIKMRRFIGQNGEITTVRHIEPLTITELPVLSSQNNDLPDGEVAVEWAINILWPQS